VGAASVLVQHDPANDDRRRVAIVPLVRGSGLAEIWTKDERVPVRSCRPVRRSIGLAQHVRVSGLEAQTAQGAPRLRSMRNDDAAPDIIELAGLARALELGGIYNGSKLVRAVLERELLIRADANRPRTGADAADRLEALADEVADHDGGRLSIALRAAAQAAREDASLALAEAPPVFTCRSCGELATGAPPERCPTCEAPALSFRDHIAVWYLEPLSSAQVLAELAAGPERVDAAVAGHDDAALAARPRPGEWSARETLEHLVSTEELLAGRLPRLLTEDDPLLVASNAWAATGGDEATTGTASGAHELASRFHDLRAQTVATLERLSPADWERTGRHPEWGIVTVRSQATYFARHQASHMAQLAAAAEGRVPGERR
jgi:uncharacterized damage-inducible protein DinB